MALVRGGSATPSRVRLPPPPLAPGGDEILLRLLGRCGEVSLCCEVSSCLRGDGLLLVLVLQLLVLLVLLSLTLGRARENTASNALKRLVVLPGVGCVVVLVLVVVLDDDGGGVTPTIVGDDGDDNVGLPVLALLLVVVLAVDLGDMVGSIPPDMGLLWWYGGVGR